MIPSFTRDGSLPKGIHRSEWNEFTGRFGHNKRRQDLLDGLTKAKKLLSRAGCKRILVCGSFVTDKVHPGDIDVLYDPTDIDEDQLDPVFFEFSNGRAEQKARFGCEFFPSTMTERSTGRPFFEFFQTDRNDMPQGIIEINIVESGD